MRVTLQSYGNGYRPTALGTIDGRPFCLRMDGRGHWFFVVAKDAVDLSTWSAWFSEPEELAFEASGFVPPMFHTESIPTFLAALRRYLDHVGVDPRESESVLHDSELQAHALMSG